MDNPLVVYSLERIIKDVMIRIMLGTVKNSRTTTSVTETVRERRSGHKKFFSGFSGATTALSKAVKTCGASMIGKCQGKTEVSRNFGVSRVLERPSK